jgi:hypothetical protein
VKIASRYEYKIATWLSADATSAAAKEKSR